MCENRDVAKYTMWNRRQDALTTAYCLMCVALYPSWEEEDRGFISFIILLVYFTVTDAYWSMQTNTCNYEPTFTN